MAIHLPGDWWKCLFFASDGWALGRVAGWLQRGQRGDKIEPNGDGVFAVPGLMSLGMRRECQVPDLEPARPGKVIQEIGGQFPMIFLADHESD